MTPSELKRSRQEAQHQDDRREVRRLPRSVEAPDVSDRAPRGRHRGRLRLRRLVDRGLARDQLVGHADEARPVDGGPRSVPQDADAVDPVRRDRSDHARAVSARSAHAREARRRVPQVDRHRRHRVLRSRGRVLHLRSRSSTPRSRTTRSSTSTPTRPAGTTSAPRRRATRASSRRPRVATASPARPISSSDLRTQMVMTMQAVGIVIETHHHEVATAGQAEIDMKYDTLVKMADQVLWYKHIVKNVARQNGKTATFMPKPLFGDNGSGMHTHQSLWKAGKPLFAGDGYAGMSDMALYYIGGLLKHAPARSARSRTRPRTATAAWSRATRRRSTWRTRRATARRRSASRCTRARPRPSASSSGRRTRRATRTWRSRR